MSVEAILVISVLLVVFGVVLTIFDRGYALIKVEPEDHYAEAFLEKIDGLRQEQLMKLGK